MKIFKYIVLVIIINILFTGCFLSTNINSGGSVGILTSSLGHPKLFDISF